MPPVVYYDCPSCLTKGHVDQNDIIRLKREGIWVPGLIITGVSYSSASSGSGGGHYVITTGLFVVGVIRIFRGLAG